MTLKMEEFSNYAGYAELYEARQAVADATEALTAFHRMYPDDCAEALENMSMAAKLAVEIQHAVLHNRQDTAFTRYMTILQEFSRRVAAGEAASTGTLN